VAELITQRANELAGLSVFADCFGADLYGLAMKLEPLGAFAGDTLMRQGDRADFFLILADGIVGICHEADDGSVVEVAIAGGQVVGEIALLRNSRRIATVVARTEVAAWRGDDDAFDELIELPGVLRMLIRTARQRMAALVTPITLKARDGSELLLRPVLPGDSERTARGRVEFSADTFSRRFMTSREPNKSLMDYLFQVDYVDHFVWVVTDVQDNVVADARFVRDEADGTSAEIAFIVGDDYQGKGLGSFLMKALVVAAQADGIEKFSARVLSENLSMRKILDDYGAEWQREDLGIVTTVIDVPDLSVLHLPRALIEQIDRVARQVIKAVG
jgi:protein lysine acetyltransferase